MIKRLVRLGAAGLIFGAILTVWAFGVEPGYIRYKTYDISLERWPEDLSGFTMAFITDTHVGAPHITLDKMAEIVQATNYLKPDLVLLGGDYVIQGVLGGTPTSSQNIVDILAKLDAPHGVYGVIGNHDAWEDAARIAAEFENAGIPMLENRSIFISAGDTGFWLAGFEDYITGTLDIETALQDVTSQHAVLALTHSPDLHPLLPEFISLTLAGHTHGGQVYLPLLGRLIVPSDYGSRYAIGLVKEGKKQIFVSPGIGTSIIPVRFLTPPEVSVLRLHPASESL